MTSPALVNLADFKARLTEALPESDEARANALLQDISAEVRSVTGLTFLEGDGQLSTVPDLVQMVTLRAAVDYWSNPSGFVSETLGSYSYNRGSAGSSASATYLSDGQIAALRGLAPRSRARSVALDGTGSVYGRPRR